jgi:peptide-methionine (S)-S-oxide reductase
MSTELATFAAGCFWGVEADFRNVPGVVDTLVGYTGGHTEDPTYEQVCTHTTGHAEAVQVTFDSDVISYAQLVRAFFELHDPTTLNRQGPDVGSQYRSAIFYHNEAQKETAESVKAELDQSEKYRCPIVTEITPAEPFYVAEKYHQRYYEKHSLRYC